MSKLYYLILLSISSLNAAPIILCAQERHFWYEWGAATTLGIIGFILLYRSVKQSSKIAYLENKLHELGYSAV